MLFTRRFAAGRPLARAARLVRPAPAAVRRAHGRSASPHERPGGPLSAADPSSRIQYVRLPAAPTPAASASASASAPAPGTGQGRPPTLPQRVQKAAGVLRSVGDAAATAPQLTSAEVGRGRTAGHLRLGFEGLAAPVLVSQLWLRDSCPCAQCVTPSSGQKTFHTHDLPARPQPQSVELVADAATGRQRLRVAWAAAATATGDTDAGRAAKAAHVSEYDGPDLYYALAQLQVPAYPMQLPRRLWDRRTMEAALRPVAYADWMADAAAVDAAGRPVAHAEFYRGLLDLYQLGLVIVDGVPDDETAVRAIAERIGRIQPTFYGELFDVVAKPAAENVAYSNVFLGLHQDLLYLNDPPYIQLLHCLRNDCDGGASLFSDSVRAAVELQLADPAALRTLAQRPVRYHYERNGHAYFGARRVVEVAPDRFGDPGGEGPSGSRPPGAMVVQNTAWSPPFQDTHGQAAVLDEPAAAGPLPDNHLGSWRHAAGRFARLLEHPDNMLEFRLQPGQCVLFNNRRVLHGRNQFRTDRGTRWFKGTYVDEQAFYSRLTDMVRDGHLPASAQVGRPGEPMPFGPPHRTYEQVCRSEQAQVQAMLDAKQA